MCGEFVNGVARVARVLDHETALLRNGVATNAAQHLGRLAREHWSENQVAAAAVLCARLGTAIRIAAHRFVIHVVIARHRLSTRDRRRLAARHRH